MKFFFTSTLIRRRRNRILTIKDGNAWIHSQENIGKYFKREFEAFFEYDIPSLPSNLNNLVSLTITVEENAELMRLPSMEEVKDTIWCLHPLKSPDPDGYQGIFYRHYWSIIKEQVTNFVQECFRTGTISKGINRSLMVLIPKSKQASNVNHYQLISLCNFSYEIVAKILTLRMTKFLNQMISLN